jgi:hypothetical protein
MDTDKVKKSRVIRQRTDKSAITNGTNKEANIRMKKIRDVDSCFRGNDKGSGNGRKGVGSRESKVGKSRV